MLGLAQERWGDDPRFPAVHELLIDVYPRVKDVRMYVFCGQLLASALASGM